MRSHVRLAAASGAVVLSLTLAACGSNSSSSGSMSGMNHTDTAAAPAPTTAAAVASAHNDADVSFAQNMIVHHQGALEISELAATRASSAQGKDLATRIQAAQGPEITQMSSWLKAWGQPSPPRPRCPVWTWVPAGPWA